MHGKYTCKMLLNEHLLSSVITNFDPFDPLHEDKLQ